MSGWKGGHGRSSAGEEVGRKRERTLGQASGRLQCGTLGRRGTSKHTRRFWSESSGENEQGQRDRAGGRAFRRR